MNTKIKSDFEAPMGNETERLRLVVFFLSLLVIVLFGFI